MHNDHSMISVADIYQEITIRILSIVIFNSDKKKLFRSVKDPNPDCDLKIAIPVRILKNISKKSQPGSVSRYVKNHNPNPDHEVPKYTIRVRIE